MAFYPDISRRELMRLSALLTGAVLAPKAARAADDPSQPVRIG